MTAYASNLACPETRQGLVEVDVAIAEQAVAAGATLRPRMGASAAGVGRTPRMMLRADGECAYPIVDGVPVLLAPEALFDPRQASTTDFDITAYSEAYREMEHYNNTAVLREAAQIAGSVWSAQLEPLRDLSDGQRSRFPTPSTRWAHSTFDLAAETDAYMHLRPITGRRVMQVGGSGTSAVKFLLAGCAEAWLVTPMLGEARFAKSLAAHFGVLNRLRVVAGVGEALPVRDETFDAAFAGGTLHHMRTDAALPELARVLRPGGRFAAVEPWRAPLYGLGKRLLGQREQPLFGKRDLGFSCQPLTRNAVAPLFGAFSSAHILHHGTLSRYPMIALWKFGIRLPDRLIRAAGDLDDRITSVMPALRRMGSSVAVLATK